MNKEPLVLNQGVLSPNTPKGVAYDTAVIPSAYTVEEFTMTNQYGDTVDIRHLVLSFTLTEEIFSPVIVLDARIRDNINFFEDFGIHGQEIIKLKLKKKGSPDKKLNDKLIPTVDLYLTVKEYPNYQKSTSTLDAQEYNLIAISEYAYLSALQRISRSVHGNTVTNIKKIFTSDLNIKEDKIDQYGTDKYPPITQFDGIITIQSPLKAIEWLRRKTFDPFGSPFFVYNTIRRNKIRIQSWLSMTDDNSRYPNKDFVYEFKPFSETHPQNDSSYMERASTILSMRSNIRLDKLEQATRGGFANKVQLTDFGVKTFTEKIFGIDRDAKITQDRLSRADNTFKNTEWGKAFGFLSGAVLTGGASTTTPAAISASKFPNMAALPDASISQVSTLAGSNNASSIYESNLAGAKSYLANMQSESHEILVYGDFRFNPGRKIEISIPKAANITAYNSAHDNVDYEYVDDRLSGEYVIAVAVHTFKDGLYTTRAQIIRDNS